MKTCAVIATFMFLMSMEGEVPGSPPPPSTVHWNILVRPRDEKGKIVEPDRFECDVVFFSPVVGTLPALRRCAQWDLFLHPERSPTGYVPWQFFAGHGTGHLALPDVTRHDGVGDHFEIVIRAYAKGYPGPAILVYPSGVRDSTDGYRPLVFYKDPGRPPVLRRPPTCTLVPAREEDPSTIPIILSVEFDRPDDEPMTFKWIFTQGRMQERGMTARASVLLGPQMFTAMACNPRGNCTTAHLPVDVQPLPGYEPHRNEYAENTPGFNQPRLDPKNKKPLKTGNFTHAYYPPTIQRCAAPK